jgi:beta-glucosidase
LDAAIQLRWTRPSNDEVANGPEPYYADAVRLASRADATVLVLGLTADLEREEHDIDYRGFFGGDRTAIELPPVQAELLKRVTAAAQQNHKPVVLVLTAGSALAIPWANDHVPAILDAWYPGQDGGTAVANALFGVTNPAGRLPVTFYAATTDLPDFEDYSMAPSDHSPGRTYRYFTRKPLYPFGYGLSYTHFSYGAANAPKSSATDADLQVSFSVTNAGDRPGDEVAQLYLSRPGTPAGLRESLVGFQRLTLAPKESRTVTFTITPYQLATIDAAGRRLVPTGDITLRCGGSSDATAGVSTIVSLTGQVATPTYKIVPPTLAQQQ